MHKKTTLAMIVFGTLALACVDGDELSLETLPGDPRFERINARLPVRIRPAAGATSPCPDNECTPEQFETLIRSTCVLEVDLTPRNISNVCGIAVSQADREVCIAQRLMTVVETAAPLTFRFGNTDVEVPAQDAETNAALASLAVDIAGNAINIISLALEPVPAAPLPAGSCNDNGLGSSAARLTNPNPAPVGHPLRGLTIAEEMARFFEEALNLIESASVAASESGAAVSEVELSRATDVAEGARSALSVAASRTASAHMLLGGRGGLPAIPGVASEGFFTRRPPSGEARAALDLLRSAAVSPALITDASVSIDDLVVGLGAVPAADSVRFRIGHYRGSAPLRDAATAALAYAYLGVARAGFSEAREYLREEFRAFDRLPTITLPAEAFADGTTTASAGITLYAATRVSPRQLLPSYWSAIVRYNNSPALYTTPLASPTAWVWQPTVSGALPDGHAWGDFTIVGGNGFVDGARTAASVLQQAAGRGAGILTRLCGTGNCTDTASGRERAGVLFARSLARFGGAPGTTMTGAPVDVTNYDNASYVGRARACLFQSAPSVATYAGVVAVEGPFVGSELRLVRGREGLECAVTGMVESVPCTTARLNALSGGAWVAAGPRTFAAGAPNLAFGRPGPDSSALFVVRLRPGGTAAPGQYEELTGVVFSRPTAAATAGYRYCTTHPITPLLDSKATELVAPDPNGEPGAEQYCAGLPRSLRIPLENELTADGFPEEGSWRHYLELATRSASEADALGEDLVRTGLEMDLRAEAASDELSRLCGVRVNLTSITDALSGRVPGMPAVSGVPPCAPPYVTNGTQCVLDPVLYAVTQSGTDEDMRRLASCIGADSVPYSTLGDLPLCVWDSTPTNPSNGLCEGATRDLPCPYPAESDGDCSSAGLPPGRTAISVTARMGLFVTPAVIEPPPPDPLDLPCEELARLRAGTATADDRTELAATPVLTYDTMTFLAQQLGWEPSVGGYSVVRFAGAQVFSTGNVVNGVGSLWPMGAGVPGGVCPSGMMRTVVEGYTGPLFCLDGLAEASNGLPPVVGPSAGFERANRARMNDLLARAVFAIRSYAGLDMGDSLLPFVPVTGYHQFEEVPGTFTYDPFGGMSGASCAADGFMVIDQFSDDPTGPSNQPLSDFASSACVLDRPDQTVDCGVDRVPEGAEWARCPYDGGPCFIVAQGPDCDDGGEPRTDNFPFLIRAAEDEALRPTGARDAAAAWAFLPRIFEEASTTSESGRRLPTFYANGFSNYGDLGGLTAVGPRNLTLPRGRTGLTRADFLNGVELACVAARQGLPVSDTSCTAPTNITSLAEALRMASYLECRANEINQRNARAIALDLPRRVVEVLGADGLGAYGTGSGEIDAEVSEIRAAFLELSTNRRAIEADLRRFAAEVRSLRSSLAASNRMREIERLSTLSNTLDRMTQCMTAVAGIATTDGAEAAGRGAQAAFTCANSIGQVLIAGNISRLRTANIGEEVIQRFASFDAASAEIMAGMSTRATSIRASLERVDAALSRLRANQMQARSALVRALGLSDDGMGAHNAVNAVYRSRLNTVLARYQAAHRRAIRSAFIARIALEQRLGMSLADIEDDLFADEAPREWVDTICTLPSIDYDALRGLPPGEGGERAMDPGLIAPDGYDGTFVGDYVRRLEDVFESYSFVHPFQAGTDTAVISVRDDILRTRAECDVASPNLLLNGGRLNRLANEERGGWEIVGCDPGVVGEDPPGEHLSRACVSVAALPGESTRNVPGGATPTGTVMTSDVGNPSGFVVRFGGSAAWTSAARLQQRVAVEPGLYRLSWYARSGSGIAPATAISATGTGVTVVQPTPYEITTVTPGGEPDWTRYWTYLTADELTELVLAVGAGGMSATPVREIHLTGVMLESMGDAFGDPSRLVDDVDDIVPAATMIPFGRSAEPAAFIESGDFGTRRLRACADRDGTWFRRDAFVPGCVRTCADGYDGSCPEEFQEVRCYREVTFSISSDELQDLLVEGDAGFAAGNYNYRIDSMAVNLVGENLRDCERTGGSAGCFASGSLSYSVLHGGPYTVRNALGALYDAPLFPGRVESARALAAERYITNPLSSADRSLVEPYTRLELRGRPLHGSLSLRIWDDPTFVFENLEDVQIILGYRYWTHQR